MERLNSNPMIENIQPSELVKEMGLNFKQDQQTPVSSYGEFQKEAFILMKNSGWN